ncbi:MAG: hypothetical protein AB4352_21345 [Hormoscilla sp.]
MDFLLVSSRLNGQVLRYDGITGEFVDVLVTAGSGGLEDPLGITLGPDRDLYVSSGILNDSVLRYDTQTGAFIDTFAVGPILDNPSSVVFGPDDNLYAISEGTNSVLRYESTGLLVEETEFVAPGSGGLNNPFDLTFGPDGDLYVSSSGTSQVLRYDGETGEFLGVFASGGGLQFPTGITFGPNGNLYVSSLFTDQVLRYNGFTGNFIGEFIDPGSDALDGPFDLVFGEDNNLYVTSGGTNEVLRYNGITGNLIDVFASGEELDGPIALVFAEAMAAPSDIDEVIIQPANDRIEVLVGNPVVFDVNYSTNPESLASTGLGLRMHWDSSQISLIAEGLTNTLTEGEQPTGTPQPDTQNLDGDPNTDFYIVKAWADAGGNWPQEEPGASERLFTANLITRNTLTETSINFTSSSIVDGVDFVASSVTLLESQTDANLDIDGNGSVNALTDGMLVLRYLLGFRGDTLTGTAVGRVAERSTSAEITNYLDPQRNAMLDVDADGIADALTDGILILRYMFGLRGEPLIEGAVGANATRVNAVEIESFLDSFDLSATPFAQSFGAEQVF